jgi:gamma-glutamylcyclotransferase (GGCT)/AIG2-like uncharacterized protein YtfP
MTTMRLFAIGSWTEGMIHFSKLRPFIVACENAQINATSYWLPIGFPVLTSTPSQVVFGQLFDLRADRTLVALLDAFHGVCPDDLQKGLHIRQEAVVQTAAGETERATVYFFNPKKLLSHRAVVVADGNWQDRMANEVPLPSQLTERQRSYLLRLGNAKGREIVPIDDLSLYRELLKLDLVVDKGRRLALSSLGRDVYSHLIG